MNLLEHPSDVASDGFLAFAAAFWTYMTPVSPMPSMHNVVTGFYTPNDYDLSLNINQGFGTTTNILSHSECLTSDGQESAAASTRATAYKEFCTLFGIEAGEETGCATMGLFSEGNSGSSFANYWFTKGEKDFACELTDQVSGYSVYGTRDYMRCVCDSWGEDTLECLVEVPDPATGAAVESLASLSAALAISAFIISII